MKITKRQLRRIIREYTRDPMERSYAATVEDYEAWVQEMGHITPSASSVLATYLIDQELDTDAERINVLTSEYKLDSSDVERDINRQLIELGVIEEAEGSTKKYDDDSALKGGQSKLPDGLQKGIIDKTVEDREEHEEEEREEKNESVRITRRQLRRIINENLGDVDTHIQDGIQALVDAEEKFYYAYDIMERQEDSRLVMLDDELDKLRNFIATMAQNLRVS